MSLLFCLVNNLIDLKLIQSHRFEPKLGDFNPIDLLRQIIAIFQPQANRQKINLSFETVTSSAFDEAKLHGFKQHLMDEDNLPELLIGDQ